MTPPPAAAYSRAAPPRIAACSAPGRALARRQRWRRLAGAVAVFFALAVCAVLPAQRPLPFDACVLHRLTGWPCLTCGLTRAVCLFARGSVRDSLLMHPAGWLAFLGLAASLLWMAV